MLCRYERVRGGCGARGVVADVRDCARARIDELRCRASQRGEVIGRVYVGTRGGGMRVILVLDEELV